MTSTQVIKDRIDKEAVFRPYLKKFRLNGNGLATALCPFHDDHQPSFSINLKSGLYRCFSCNASGDVISFYERVKGIDFNTALAELERLTGSQPWIQPRVVATFAYRSLEAKELYFKERVQPGHDGRSKEFRFFHIDVNGKRQSGRGGNPVLYRLPEVIKSELVFIVEGEAKADLLSRWGLTATCLDSGANSKLTDEMINQLTGKVITILPDNDKPGKDFSQYKAARLHGKAKVLKVVPLPGLLEKEDIIDWARQEGNDKTRLQELADEAPGWVATLEQSGGVTGLYRFCDLKRADLPKREEIMTGIRRGEVTELVSVSNVGKSTLMTNAILSLLANREFFPLVKGHHSPCVSLYVDCESTATVLRNDIEVMKGCLANGSDIDQNLLVWVDGTVDDEPLSFEKPNHLSQLRRIIEEQKVDLVVIDTVTAGFCLRNENDNAEVKAKVMGPLAELARRCNCAIVIIHHHGKPSESGGAAPYYGRGASNFGALARTVYTLTKDANKGDDYVLLSCPKVKGKSVESVSLHLDRESRWFSLVGTAVSLGTKDVSVSEIQKHIEVVGGVTSRKTIVEKFSNVSPSTIDRRLKEGTGIGAFSSDGGGTYSLCQFVTPISSDKVTKAEAPEAIEIEI